MNTSGPLHQYTFEELMALMQTALKLHGDKKHAADWLIDLIRKKPEIMVDVFIDAGIRIENTKHLVKELQRKYAALSRDYPGE